MSGYRRQWLQMLQVEQGQDQGSVVVYIVPLDHPFHSFIVCKENVQIQSMSKDNQNLEENWNKNLEENWNFRVLVLTEVKLVLSKTCVYIFISLAESMLPFEVL